MFSPCQYFITIMFLSSFSLFLSVMAPSGSLLATVMFYAMSIDPPIHKIAA